ncbi:MAG: type IV pilus assembly protein PilQ [Bradymonadia bacterium]|jgi:type IV pilus assembly protein PilQ
MVSTYRAALLVVLALVASPVAAQDTLNQIEGVQLVEQDDHTEIRISGNSHPTYSVYRLRNPLRVFVDISQSELATDSNSVDVDNGVVSQLGVMDYADELMQTTRVVIGFDVDAMYDVDVDGNDIVVRVDGTQRRLFVARAPSSVEDFERLQFEIVASQDRIDAIEAEAGVAAGRADQAEAALLQAQADRAREEQARLQAIANANQARGQYDAMVETHGEALVQLSMLEGEVRTQGETIESQTQQLEALSSDREEALDSIAGLQRQLEDQNATLQRRSADVDSLTAEVAQGVAAGADQAELAALRAQLADREAEAQLLREQNLEAQGQLDDSLARARQAQAAQQLMLAQQETQAAQATDNAIRNIRFEHADGFDRVIVEVANTADFNALPPANGRAALELPGATLPDELRRTLDTQAFDGPVDFVSSFTDDSGVVRVLVEYQGEASELVRREGNEIVWEFAAISDQEYNATVATSSAPNAQPYATPYTSQNMATPYEVGSGRGSTSATASRPLMARKRITIDLRNADLANVLRLIADEGNVNIVAGEGVEGMVTLRLRSVPLDEALVMILRSQGLGWEQEGSIIRVAPAEDFIEELEARNELLQGAWRRQPLRVRVIPVNYAEAARISGLVYGVLTSRGNLSVDARNNTLVVTDIASQLDMVQQLVERLDTQTPQVLIEARIVETNDQFRRQLGIQWGGDYVADQSIGNATGLLFPSTVGVAGGAPGGPTAGTSSSPNYVVNLPAPAGDGSGGALGFTFGSLSGAFNLNLRLSAAEESGSAKVISAPRILTLHNERASITSGVSIPVSIVSAAGAQTVFFDATLQLDVEPRVTADGNVFLDVQVTKNEPDFENTGARGDPSIVRREARTQLLVRDGDTSVIGGIFQRNTGFSQSRVPFFGRLPVIGPLFRNSSQTDVRNELLVFITPRIVNREASIDRLSGGADFTPTSPEMNGGGSNGGSGNRSNRRRRRNNTR